MEVKHGWLRNIRWDLTGADRDGEDVVLALGTPEDVRALGASIRFRIGGELSVDLTVTAANRTLELEAALHTYHAVGDVRGRAVGGLQGAYYLDTTGSL